MSLRSLSNCDKTQRELTLTPNHHDWAISSTHRRNSKDQTGYSLWCQVLPPRTEGPGFCFTPPHPFHDQFATTLFADNAVPLKSCTGSHHQITKGTRTTSLAMGPMEDTWPVSLVHIALKMWSNVSFSFARHGGRRTLGVNKCRPLYPGMVW